MALRVSRHKLMVLARSQAILSPTRSCYTYFRVSGVLNINLAANYGSNADAAGYDNDNPPALQEPQHKIGSYVDADSGRIDISSPTFMVWGSNTGVGKTLVSAGLVISALSHLETPKSDIRDATKQGPNYDRKQDREVEVTYLKPLQTGFPKGPSNHLHLSSFP